MINPVIEVLLEETIEKIIFTCPDCEDRLTFERVGCMEGELHGTVYCKCSIWRCSLPEATAKQVKIKPSSWLFFRK